jgi:hypothetical protein
VNWFLRESYLVTALGALIVVLEPTWLAVVVRPWLVIIALLGAGAILSEVFRRVPGEPKPVRPALGTHLGEVRQMRDIEQANDFLVAVDYQLFPFLRDAVRDIAAQRLLVHHNVEFEHQPSKSRELLGDATWQLVRPAARNAGDRQWGTISAAQLATVTDALERL